MDSDTLFRRFGRTFPAGTVLFEQGETGNEMYIISSGRVEVSRRVRDKETVLAVLPAGEFLGEMSIINNKPRSATARVIEDARVLVIDPKTFEQMLRSNSEIAVRLIKKLAQRLDETGRQIEVLLFRDPNSRVVHYLRQEADRRGQPDATGVRVDISPDDLAEKLGLTDAEVHTVLNRLERSRLISAVPEGGFLVAEVGRLQDFLDFLEMKERFGQG